MAIHHRGRSRAAAVTVSPVNPRHRVSRAFGAVLAATLAGSLLLAPQAAAAPAASHPAPQLPAPRPADPADTVDPDNSADAKQLWIETSEKAEAMNEKVLVVAEKEKAAKAAAAKATESLEAKKQARADAEAAATKADKAAVDSKTKLRAARKAEADYQEQVDQFAGASFRGASFGSMTALLTADSPEDFLDTATTLDVIAADTQQTLTKAATAKADATQAEAEADAAAGAAETAAKKADTAVDEAATAKKDAEAAKKAAQQATAEATERQADLEAESNRLEELYNQLTEVERQAAIRAEEEARAEAARQAEAQARADRAARAAAPAPAADDQAATGQAAAEAPAADDQQAAEEAPAEEEAPAAPAASGAAGVAVQAALSKVGSAYVFGAAGPNAFDCSGLTSWAWAQAGVSIPRTSGGQAGLQSVPLDQLQPGDLVTYYSPVHHVGMYIGNGQIVHASTSSKPVYVTDVFYGGPNPSGHRVTG